MTATTKNLLLRSIQEFEKTPQEKRTEKINHCKHNLQMHQEGLTRIGIGYANQFVQGAEIFLRIYKNK